MFSSRTYKFFIITLGLLYSSLLYAQDITSPDTPVIDSVSVQWEHPVNLNGDVRISWAKCDSVDVRSYYIKYLNEVLGTYNLLDSVDANTITYLDTAEITDPHHAQSYVVQAVDYANNTSNYSSLHKTVRVFPWQVEENCQVKVELSWNAYLGWEKAVDYYDIYVIKDNSVTDYIGRFGSNIRTYIYTVPENVSHLEFYIKLKGIDGSSSTSNKVPFNPILPQKPAYIQANFASVESKQAMVQFKIDQTADIKNYRLMRSSNTRDNFKIIAEFNDYNEAILDYSDSEVKINKEQYFYRLDLYNDCSEFIDSSNTVSTILLEGEVNTQEHFQYLYWTEYYNKDMNENIYGLYRESEAEYPNMVYSSASNLNYKDDLLDEEFESLVGGFCYQIFEESNTTAFVKKSNKVCLSQPPSVIVPSAFAPYGKEENRIFKPSYAFISDKDYYFSVFDRWGLLIFETSNPKQGWNGKNGELAYPNAMYTYVLRYYSSRNVKFEQTGTFNLFN